jgi:hypothetical protein
METTKQKLSTNHSIFFTKLSEYLDTKIYYFGSIQRYDYFPKYSDIDVDIFTENETSTISKMQHFLHKEKYQFKKFIYRLGKSKKLVEGYKISYKKKEQNLNVEFSIYNEKFKEDVLEEHKRKMDLPFYVSFFLILLKFIYYNFGIIPTFIYYKIKQFLINICIDGQNTEFVVIDLSDE